MTRRFAVLLSLAAVLAIPSRALAATVTINDYLGGDPLFTSNAPGGGGPFTATTGDSGPLGDVSFLTFCIEFNEHFSYGGTYNYALTTGAVNGGVGGPNPDLVDDATKWLYAEVLTGGYLLIPQFGSGNVGARVQEAIWYLEGERESGDIDPASKTLADYAFNNQTWNTTFAANGFTVYAMNLTLTDAAGNVSLFQDQLAMTTPTVTELDLTPVPEPATLLLLGTGLLATSRKLVRRKTRS